MSSLRQRMIQDLRVRNYSPRTIEIYTRAVAQFAHHFGKSPRQLGAEHIREYQVYLVETKKASWAWFNQSVCALRFLYNVTLGRKEMIEHIRFAKKEKKLPVVLSAQELGRFFQSISYLKHRAVLMTMYGAGLRLSEALGLRVEDIDSERGVLRVRQGKGRKDRYAPLSGTLVEALRTYWRAYRPKSYLFPDESPDRPLSPSSIQKACKTALLKSGLTKPVCTHTMRHPHVHGVVPAGGISPDRRNWIDCRKDFLLPVLQERTPPHRATPRPVGRVVIVTRVRGYLMTLPGGELIVTSADGMFPSVRLVLCADRCVAATGTHFKPSVRRLLGPSHRSNRTRPAQLEHADGCRPTLKTSVRLDPLFQAP